MVTATDPPGHHHHLRMVVAFTAVALMAVGCGGESDQRIQAAIDDESIVSPLNFLLGVVDEDGDRIIAAEREAQAEIADCMAVAGFTYIPVEIPDAAGPEGMGRLVPGEVDEDVVREAGYGIADSLAAVALESEVPEVDPNEEIRAGLAPAEQEAYDVAISGLTPDEVVWDDVSGAPLDPDSGEELTHAEFAEASADGCLSQAYEDFAVGDGSAAILAGREYEDLQARILSDDRMIELFDEWSRCMSEQGYAYSSSDQLVGALLVQADELEHEILEDHHDVSTDEAEQAIAELRALEGELAVADFRCSEPLAEQAPEIAREYEIEFLRENEAAIVRILDEQT